MVDLEGFERAYRLRSSADDGLLKQVFGGEDELAQLQRSNPSLVETAKSYFPHLTSSTYERLAREPDALQVEKDRCEREMEQLAVQNYGAFIGASKVTHSVRQELTDIQKQLDTMAETLGPAQEGIKGFKTIAEDLSSRRSALRNVREQQSSLLEFLELPQLLDACIRNQMYDESLELLAYCGNLLQAHEARGEHIPVLSTLQQQITVQRANLHASLVAQLRTDIHLPACVRVIGFLRRIQRHSEEELRNLFIEHRGSFLESHKQQVEMLRGNRGSVVTALRNAADLVRTHVYDIGTQYRALFPSDDNPMVAWLNEQIMWLTDLLRAHVLPMPIVDDAKLGAAQQRGLATRSAASSIAGAGRMDAAALTTVLKQCLHASSTLKRLGGHFFPSVAGIFEARMEQHVCELIDLALVTLHAELGRYDWVPSTALSGTTVGHAGEDGQGGLSWLHPQALDLTRHRPLAVFTNDIIQMFNELRQCAMFGLRVPVVTHTHECLQGAINLLRSVKLSQTFQPGSPKAAELVKFAQNFAHILAPLVAAHLEQVFGASARLDVEAITASMVPDLLPAAETVDPALLEVGEDPVQEPVASVGASGEGAADITATESAGVAPQSSGAVDPGPEQSVVEPETPAAQVEASSIAGLAASSVELEASTAEPAAPASEAGASTAEPEALTAMHDASSTAEPSPVAGAPPALSAAQAQPTDPFTAPAPLNDPFAAPAPLNDPFAAPAPLNDQFAAPAPPADPFAATAPPNDPFAAPAPPADPFAATPPPNDPFAAPASPTDPLATSLPAAVAPAEHQPAPAQPSEVGG